MIQRPLWLRSASPQTITCDFPVFWLKERTEEHLQPYSVRKNTGFKTSVQIKTRVLQKIRIQQGKPGFCSIENKTSV